MKQQKHFTLIELLVVIAQYCRNHVKVLYNRIGMQGAGGGALAGNTMNTIEYYEYREYECAAETGFWGTT